MRSVCECSRKSHDIHCMPSRAFDILNNARISSPRALFNAPTQRVRTIGLARWTIVLEGKRQEQERGWEWGSGGGMEGEKRREGGEGGRER